MNGQHSSGARVRRATTEDLADLVALWNLMRFPAEEFARKVTEFQVVEDTGGNFIGAVGLEVHERQGRLHSEGFVDFALAEQSRPLLWDRITALANNHGLMNIWTQEQAPFWKRAGFLEPREGAESVPNTWRGHHGRWLVLKLREDADALLSVDEQFAAFMQKEKAQTQRAIQRARTLKTFATLVAAAVLVLVIMAGWYIIRNHPTLR